MNDQQNPEQNKANRIVAIAGAGIAGLTAAKILAGRGFSPIVFEKQAVAGGQINWADKPPHKEQLGEMIVSLQKELEALGVEIRFNTTANVENLLELNPYAVFVATGALPLRPQSVAGINLPQVLTVAELFDGKHSVENKRVALIGSGAAGLEIAEYLCVNGNHLTIVEMRDAIGEGIDRTLYESLAAKLAQYEICYLPSHQLIGVTQQAVEIKNLKTGEIKKLETDYTILTLGVRSVNELAQELASRFDKVYAIGDAAISGRIGDAVRSAVQAASALK